MHGILLAVAVLGASAPIENGAILMLQNSNKVVSGFTDSDITHLAIILRAEGRTWVYEATPAKVRRVLLKQYYSEISLLNRDRQPATRVWLKRPRRAFSDDEEARLRNYLNSQLGRRYSIRGYVRDDAGDGIHCAALTAEAMQRTGRVAFSEPQRENPSTVMLRLREHYRPSEYVVIPPAPPSRKPLCVRVWHSFQGFRLWCGWSLYESLRFCF